MIMKIFFSNFWSRCFCWWKYS